MTSRRINNLLMKNTVGPEGQHVLKDVYNSIDIKTREGYGISLCQRDGGFEIRTEDQLIILLPNEKIKTIGLSSAKDVMDKPDLLKEVIPTMGDAIDDIDRKIQELITLDSLDPYLDGKKQAYKIANRKFNEAFSNVLKSLKERRDVLRERYRETKLKDESLRIISQLDELNWAIFLLVEKQLHLLIMLAITLKQVL
jgi:hypothetical protein